MITKYFQSIKNIKTTIPVTVFQVQKNSLHFACHSLSKFVVFAIGGRVRACHSLSNSKWLRPEG